MELRLSAARIVWRDGKDFSKPGMAVGFKAVPLGFETIKLKTGETFGSPLHKRVYGKGNNVIDARLYIGSEIIDKSGREWHSEMAYLNGLFFSICLPEEQVKELQKLILAGNVPRSAFILFGNETESGFSYGSLPDGEDMAWDNDINRKVAIRSVNFDNFSIPGFADTSLPTEGEEEESSSTVIDAKVALITKELSLIRYLLVILVVMVGLVIWSHR